MQFTTTSAKDENGEFIIAAEMTAEEFRTMLLSLQTYKYATFGETQKQVVSMIVDSVTFDNEREAGRPSAVRDLAENIDQRRADLEKRLTSECFIDGCTNPAPPGQIMCSWHLSD